MNEKLVSKRHTRPARNETLMMSTGIGEIINELSPFTDSEEPTPVCICPNIIVTKKVHNILYSLAFISITSASYGFVSTLLKMCLGEEIGVVDYATAGTSLTTALGAGITLFCAKKPSNNVRYEDNSDYILEPKW